MASTTSLKLPEALKATIAQVAASEGKTAHVLTADTLQSAMEAGAISPCAQHGRAAGPQRRLR